MPQEAPKPIVPPLLQEPDREENLAKAETALTKAWEALPGPPLTENAASGMALSALELAANWDQFQWLLDAVRKGCERRPAPVEMRRIFTMRFPAADGLTDDAVDKSDYMGGYRKRATGE